MHGLVLLGLLLALRPVSSQPGGCLLDVNYSTTSDGYNASAFVGSFALLSEAEANISSWVLAWRFTAGERVSSKEDIVPAGNLELADTQVLSTTQGPQSVAVTSNTPVPASGVVFNFMARLDTDYARPAPSFKLPQSALPPGQVGRRALLAAAQAAGIPADVTFNGLVCTPVKPVPGAASALNPSSSDADSQVAFAEPLLPDSNIPRALLVEYMPVQYTTESGTLDLFSNSFTQMVIRLSNTGSRTVPLGDVVLQYWFDVPEMDMSSAGGRDTGSGGGGGNGGGGGGGGGVQTATATFPGTTDLSGASNGSGAPSALSSLQALQFKMYCSDASAELVGGCDALQGTFSTGLSGVHGAQLVLNLYFKSGSGLLVPSVNQDNSSLALTLLRKQGQPAMSALDLIISIEPERYSTQLDASQDYSYLNTPLRNDSVKVQANSKVLLRMLAPNPRIPAYVAGLLAWGSPPKAGDLMPASQVAAQESSESSIADGLICDAATQSCRVSVAYCCQLTANTTTWPGTLPDLSQPPASWQASWQRSYQQAVTALGMGAGGGGGGGGGINTSSGGAGQQDNGADNNTGSKPLSPARIAGVVVGVVVGAACLLALLVTLLLKKQRRQRGSHVMARDTGYAPLDSPDEGLLSTPTGTGSNHVTVRDSITALPVSPRAGHSTSARVKPVSHGSSNGIGSYLLQSLCGTVEADQLQGVGVGGRDGGRGGGRDGGRLPDTAPEVPRRTSTFHRALQVFLTACGIPRRDSRGGVGSGGGAAGGIPLSTVSAWVSTPAGSQQHVVLHVGPPWASAAVTGTEQVLGPSCGWGRLTLDDERYLCQPHPLPWHDKCPTMPPALHDGHDTSMWLALQDILTACLPAAGGWKQHAGSTQAAARYNAPGPWGQHAGAHQGQQANQQHDWTLGEKRVDGHHYQHQQQYHDQQNSPRWLHQQQRQPAGSPHLRQPGERPCSTAGDGEQGVSQHEGSHHGTLDTLDNTMSDSRLNLGHRVMLLPVAHGIQHVIRPKCATWSWYTAARDDDTWSNCLHVTPLGMCHLRPAPRYPLTAPSSVIGAAGAVAGCVLPPPQEPIDLCIDYTTEVAPGLGRLIGVGGFGRVYEAVWRGRRVAVKVMTCEGPQHYQVLVREVEMCAQFRDCPYIIKLLGACLVAQYHQHNHQHNHHHNHQHSHQHNHQHTHQHNHQPSHRHHNTPSATTPPTMTTAVPHPGAAVPAAAAPIADPHDHHPAAAPGVPSCRSHHTSSPAQAASCDLLSDTASSAAATSLQGETATAGTPGSSAAAMMMHSDSSSDLVTKQGAADGVAAAPTTPSVPLAMSLTRTSDVPTQVVLIMELAECNLAQRLHAPATHPLTTMEVLQMSRDIAAGLAVLHSAGLIHRDLKPQNVLLVNGTAKIADFGISKYKDPFRSFVSVTQQGGTPQYMAPEQFNGTRVDEKCDVYALGCIMYEAFTGQVPWSELSPLPAAAIPAAIPAGAPVCAMPAPGVPSPAMPAPAMPAGAAAAGVAAAVRPLAAGAVGEGREPTAAGGVPAAGGIAAAVGQAARASIPPALTPVQAPAAAAAAAGTTAHATCGADGPQPPSSLPPAAHTTSGPVGAHPPAPTDRLIMLLTPAPPALPPCSQHADENKTGAAARVQGLRQDNVVTCEPQVVVCEGSQHSPTSPAVAQPVGDGASLQLGQSQQLNASQLAPYGTDTDAPASPPPAPSAVASTDVLHVAEVPAQQLQHVAEVRAQQEQQAAQAQPQQEQQAAQAQPQQQQQAAQGGQLSTQDAGRGDTGVLMGMAGAAVPQLPMAGMGVLFQIILAVAIHGRRPSLPDHVPPGLRLLIRQCWRESPKSRPSVQQVCERLDALIHQEHERQAARRGRGRAPTGVAAGGGGRGTPNRSRHG